jgi:uncharacterized protein (UPF0297 family)
MEPGGCLYVDEDEDEPVQESQEIIVENNDREEGGEQEEEKEVSKPPVVERPPLFEAPIQLGDCPICYESLKMIDFTVTKCGHTFHSSCVFRALEENTDCPMCRCELVQLSYDPEYDEEGGEEDREYDDDVENDNESTTPNLTLEQIYEKLQNFGYTPLDILGYILQSEQGIKRADETRQTDEFHEKISEKIWGIACGNISLADRDLRTYAQVTAQPPSHSTYANEVNNL